MVHFPKWKVFLILGTCLLGILYALPNFVSRDQLKLLPSWLPHQQVVLGLDLQGGAHLLLEIDFDTVLKEQMTSLVDAVRTTLRKERVGYIGLTAHKDKVKLSLRRIEDAGQVKSLFRKLDPQLEVSILEGQVTIELSHAAIQERRRSALAQSIEIVRRRIDETGTAEPFIQQQGDDRILIQLPGLQDPSRIKKLLGETAKLQFQFIDSSVPIESALQGKVPPGSKILPSYNKGSREEQRHYLVKKRVMVSGENLVDARPSFDEYNRPVVSFKFDSLGGRRFGEATKTNVGKHFAIILDGKVISAPVIHTPILDGSGQISGGFTAQAAQDLALLMRAGALPAPLKILEERTVGPGLGADSIAAGKTATIISIIMVVIFMLIAYSLFGIIANIALLFNLILLIAALSITQATLTLPGIAGIALTIGMAVDANVLINERIKEEWRLGRKIMGAIDSGYSRAMTTIIDSNLTTLIGAALLYVFGTGPIRGFAVTLSMGVLISMFTAISLTRLIVVRWLKWKRPTKLPI